VKRRLQSWLQILGRVPAGWWVVLLALPALAPLARAGFFQSHDGLFHVYRLAALDRAVRAGVLYPRWFPEFGFGYGQPVLNFYGPLSYYWGLPFTLLGSDAALALKLVLAGGLLASALGMYLFARLHLDRGPALVAAVIYAYLPYHLVDLYVRGAVAEFLAFIWFPLVLWAFHRLIRDAARPKFTHIGLAALLLAALILTHNLSAFIFAPVLAVYLLILLARARHDHLWRRTLLTLTLTLTLALALTAFYWLPVLAESQYVGLGHGASQGYQDHLVSLSSLFEWGSTYPYTDEPGVTPTFPLGWLQVAILAAALILPFRPRPGRWAAVFFLAVALVSVFMLTAASLPVWRLFEPGLAFLQYPWRFQALAVLASAFLAGALFQGAKGQEQTNSLSGKPLAACGLVLIAAIWSLWHLPVTPTTPDLSVEAMWHVDRDNGQVGATWTGEYLPIWVTEQRWALSLPASVPPPGGVLLPAGQIKLVGVGYNRYDLELQAAQATSLKLHQFHFPGWQAAGQAAGSPRSSRPVGVLGLAAVDLPPASGSLAVHLGLTASQRFGTLLSLLAFLVAGVALFAQYQFPQVQSTRSRFSTLPLAACFLLPAAMLIAHLALPNGYVHQVMPVNANLENTVELLAFTTDRDSYHPGDTVGVTLYWRALRGMEQDYKAFVHLTNADLTAQPAQHDGDPGGGFSPTTRWLPGELVPDSHRLLLPPGLAPGRYRLWAGMYQYEPLRNLSVLAASSPAADNRVFLGEIEVLAP
jgi:hypothetical protein